MEIKTNNMKKQNYGSLTVLSIRCEEVIDVNLNTDHQN
jgi:hypothetical protein